MKASRFASRFRRAGTPAEPKADIAATVAAPGADAAPADAAGEAKAPEPAKAEAASPEPAAPPEPATPAPEPKRASRLVEAVRPKRFANPLPMDVLRDRLRAAKPAAKPAAAAAAIVLSLALGYGFGLDRAGGGGAATARWMDATATEIRQAHQELARFAADQKALKASLDALRGEREKSRAEILSRQAAVAEKVEKAGQDQTARIARLAEIVDRLEKTQRDPGRLQALTDRLERVEKGLAAPAAAAGPTPTPPPKPVAAARDAAPADVAQTGSIAEAKPAKPDIDPRKTQVEGYFVRDFDSGFALVETRAGRYIDVAVGYTVPGVGRVEAIERRGRQWIVVTNKGFIGER